MKQCIDGRVASIITVTIMSHVKNAEAFTRMVNFCTGFGGMYIPGRPTLQIDALTSQVNQVHAALDAVKQAKAKYDELVNQRKQAFDLVPKILAGTLRRLEASGTKPEQLEDARAYVHQFIGSAPRNRTPIPSEMTESAPVTRGLLQLAYTSKVDAFSKLVEALKASTVYQAQEPTYTVAGLEAKVQELAQLNQAVDMARKAWRMKIINRDQLLYENEDSMYQVAFAVKKYVRGLFGPNSGEYALVRELKFTKPGNS